MEGISRSRPFPVPLTAHASVAENCIPELIGTAQLTIDHVAYVVLVQVRPDNWVNAVPHVHEVGLASVHVIINDGYVLQAYPRLPL